MASPTHALHRSPPLGVTRLPGSCQCSVLEHHQHCGIKPPSFHLRCREREAKRAERASLEAQLEGQLRQMHTWDTQRSTKQRAVEEYVQLVRRHVVLSIYVLRNVGLGMR